MIEAFALQIARAEEVGRKWQAAAAKLRAEIARRELSGRQTKALSRARVALARAERSAQNAANRVADLKKKEKQAEDRKARGAQFVASMAPVLNKIAAAAPEVMKRWRRERKEEKKRIAKRKKELARRVAGQQDAGEAAKAHFGIGSTPKEEEAPAVEAETWPTGPIVPYVPKPAAVDREGLLPGEYRLIDRVDDFDNYRLPKDWTAKHVGVRMSEAFSVLRRLPMVTHPKGFGSAMPDYVHEGVELLYRADHGKRRGPIRGTSADEVARMTTALGWPITYLLKRPDLARALNEWAICNSWDDRETMDASAHEAALIVAVELSKGKVRVT